MSSSKHETHSSSRRDGLPPPGANANGKVSLSSETFGHLASNAQEERVADSAMAKRAEEDARSGEDEGEDEAATQGGESTGRWTKEEHELFLEALRRYGKEWKKVASMVKTRTVVQTRTHAQKYFQKLAKTSAEEQAASERGVADRSKFSASAAPPSSSKRARFDDALAAAAAPMGDARNFVEPFFHAPGLPVPVSSIFPSLYLPPPPPPPQQDFPQPSPAACGRRKHMELSAAQFLASGGSSHVADLEGALLLTSMKERSIGTGKRDRPSGHALSIINPQGLGSQSHDSSEPGTPWEKEISALVERQPSNQVPFWHSEREPRDLLEELFASIVALDDAAVCDKLNRIGSDSRGIELLRTVLGLEVDGTTQCTLLLCAVTAGDSTSGNQMTIYAMCKALLEHGSSAIACDGNGNTALHLAAFRGYDRVGELLLTKGVPINRTNGAGDAAVHVAARAGHIPFVQMLARLGANFHLRNDSALSALDLAGSSSSDPDERKALRKAMLLSEPRLRSLILYHEDFLDHTARRPSDWEGPDRLRNIMSRLTNSEEFPEYAVEISSKFDKAHVELLGRVHSPEYLAFVNKLSKEVQSSEEEAPAFSAVPFTPQVQKHVLNQSPENVKRDEHCDTSFSSGTLNAARRAAGAVAHAVDRVMLGRNRNAFCAIRPPGHHAGFRGLLDGANSCGFCIFNNVAAGALHALSEHLCERVAIVDIDIHHGNGTEDIVRRYEHPSRLFFFSVHLFDHDPSSNYQFYPGTGSVDDHVHNIINVPIPPMWRNSAVSKKHSNADNTEHKFQSDGPCGRTAFRQAISQRLIPSLRAFNPDLILISSGFDAAAGDVGNCLHKSGTSILNGMDLLPDDFAWATTEILKIADICCGGRAVSVLEGGYGEYESHGESRKQKTYSTRSTDCQEIDANAMESYMNRAILAKSVAAHVHRLVDPYCMSTHSHSSDE